ncbi:MAG: transposase, partial [Candidatus Omnitrophota bacterium]
ALDAVKLLITGTKKYENFGRITYRKNGELIKEKGYKLVFIQKVDGDDYFVVAAVLLPLNAHESTVAERLVEEALAILGSSAINILLFDRGFLGGEFFDFLDDKKIHFVCPTRDDQHLTRHMQGLHRTGEEVKTILPDETILAGYDHLIKMESCQRKINGVLILKQTKKSRKQVKEGKEFGFLTSLPTSYSSQIERVYSLYSRRWKIETNGNRELKQGWYLNNFPSRSWNGISAHIYFTLFMFNVITAYKSGQGRALTEKGIVSLRHKHFKPFPHQPEVTATADGYTATYSLGEFAELFGLPPPSGKHRNSRWGRLPDGRRALFVLKESLLGD